MSIRIDASEVRALAINLGEIGTEALPVVRGVIQEGAAALKDQWRANAAGTAGVHGKHYPDSITYETRLMAAGAEAEIGPDSGRPQGGMSFEEGSVNQPPHLDGAHAADALLPRIQRRVDLALGSIL